MLSCKDISELASENLDKKLPVFKRLQFRMHLMMCRNCRQFIQQLQLTINTVSKLKPVEPAPTEIEKQVNNLIAMVKTSIKPEHSDTDHR